MRGNHVISINIWRAKSPAETKRTLDMLRRAVLLGFHGDVQPVQGCAGNSVHRRDLGMSVDMLSQIMGVFSIAGMLLAFPGMLVMQRFGVKFSIVVTSIIQLIGSFICAFSGDTAIFLVGRTLEAWHTASFASSVRTSCRDCSR